MLRPILALATLVLTTSVAQAQFTIDQPLGFDTFGNKGTGQTFTPNVGAVPSLGAATTIHLKEITFFQGNLGAFAPSTTTFLNIYDGDPNGSGTFIGSSTNSIDTTTGIVFHTPMLWTFNSLSLSTSVEHWAVMSSTNTPGGLDIGVSLETQDRNIVPSVYTGGTGLIANYAPHSNLIDVTFKIVMEDATWINLGNALPGVAGSPALNGQGALVGGGSVTLSLGNAAPNTTSGLFIGTSNVSLPLYGGVLVPSPNLFLLIPLGAGGGYSLPAIYPTGLPAGIPFYFQAWIADATGPQGFTASNALATTTQ